MRPRLLLLTTALLALASCSDDSGNPATEGSASPSVTQSPSGSEPTPTESPSPSASATPTEAGTPFRLTAEGLATGAAPAVPYLRALDADRPAFGWQLVRPDGSTTPVPDGNFTAFAPMGEGLVAISADGERPTVVVLDGTGRLVRSTAARGYALAVSPGGQIVGWLGPSGAPHVIEAGGAREFDMPTVREGSEIAAIRGKRTCREAPPEHGCTVWVNTADASRSWISNSHGFVDFSRNIKAVRDVTAAGRVAGLVSVADDGSCSGVWKNPSQRMWQTCDFTLTQFSPGRSHVLGTDPYLDGLGQRTLAFLNSKHGDVLTEFESPRNGPTIIQTAWEDDRHVLAVVVAGRQWSVLRVGADGSMEYAVAPVAGDEVSRPYVLPAG